jgi:hypothetical protein
MKNMIKSAIMLGLVLLFAGTTQKAMAQGEDVSLQSFYDELSPYGTWIQDPQYGYVWRPDVDQDEFRPYYSNGRWAMTEYGNTWVSDYDWGWAPFHYGRWIYNRYNQWVWLPDTVWGPAWVSWRSGGGQYGWAPLGPSINIGINIGHGGYRIPDMCWNFVPYSNIYYSSYPRYYSNRNRVYIQNTVIINNTYVRNNRTYYTGPRVDDIRRNTNQRVTVYNVNRSYGSGRTQINNNTVNIYQPRPTRASNNSNPSPRNAVQGSINRGPVGRDNNMSASRGGDNRNGDVRSNNGQGRTENRNGGFDPINNRSESRGNIDNRNGNPIGNRPQRGENGTNNVQGRDNGNSIGARPQSESRGSERPAGFDRGNRNDNQPQRIERTAPSEMQQPQRMERSRDMSQAPPQRVERPREMQQAPQREERQQPQQQAPQPRMERSQVQPQSQPRVERQQQAPQQRGGGGESRGGESRGGGRPGRG